MFKSPPASCPAMLSLLFPSARRHCASARLEQWKGAASRMGTA